MGSGKDCTIVQAEISCQLEWGRLLGRFVTRANVEKAREDGGGVNNVVAADKERVNQLHEQWGSLRQTEEAEETRKEKGRAEGFLSFFSGITRVHGAAQSRTLEARE